VTRALLGLLVLLIAGCAAPSPPLGTRIVPPSLAVEGDRLALTASDGLVLPGRVWAADDPVAVAVAVHGFNDYSAAFDTLGPALVAADVTVYAHDQRGFGEAPGWNSWPGATRLLEDLMDMAAAVRARHPDRSLVLVGESMGGALVMEAVADPPLVDADRAVLLAPAVWGRGAMGAFGIAALDLAHDLIPGYHLTFQSALRPTDSRETLRRMAEDPLVIKGARIDAVHGLVGLMDNADRAAAHLRMPALILYGARDAIVPKEPTCRMLARLPAAHRVRVAVYADGFHMLTRDRGGAAVIADIAAFARAADAPLPSGAEAADAWPAAICGARGQGPE